MDSCSIVILGNGFDVALGIPTRYSQFYENSQELREYANNGNALCQHILDNIRGDYWSDLECGLYQYSLSLTQKYGEGNVEQSTRFKNEFFELRTALFNYLQQVAGTIVDVEKQLPVFGLNIEWHVLQPQYLTFNYSINTANTVSMNGRYILNNDDTINENRFIYQHGSIYDTKKCENRCPEDIVVGIDPNTQQVELAHSFLYKSQQRLRDLNSTIGSIRDKQLYIIYGCSIGDSDATYFRAVFNLFQYNKTYLIYGYGQNAIANIKSNIEKICKVNLEVLESNNQVLFLDVTQVEDTRKKTQEIINNYLQLMVKG